MKAKRLTALALAALMAASTTSVALAIRVDDDLTFVRDGYYKYNSDTNRIESVDRRDDYQPGDDVYLRLDSSVSLPKEQTYNVYADWTIGESWVKDVEIVYRKGDVITSTSTTYDWTFNGGSSGVLAGWTASGTGLASQDNSAVKTALKGKPEFSQYVDKYINDNYIKIPATDNAWTDNQGRYWLNEANAKAGNGITGDITTWYIEGVDLGETFSTREDLVAKLTNVSAENYICNNVVYADIPNLIKSLAGGEDKAKQIYVTDAKQSDNFGKEGDFAESQDEDTFKNPVNAYVFEVAGSKYYVLSTAVSSITADNLIGASGLNITQIQKGSDHADDYYVTGKGTYVDSTAIKPDTKTESEQMTEKGVQQVVGDKYLNKGGKEGDKFVTENVETTATNAVTSAIDSADSSIVWKSNTVTNTQPQYEYWVKITTKDSTTTKDIDVVGNIYVGEGTSKTSIKKGDKFSADFILTNSEPTNSDYDEATDYVSIEPGTRAVVSFADDASDEFEVEFGDDAYFVFNARGQGKLNLAYNTKFNKDFAYDYDDANIDFINFEGEPTTNRTGTLYIYADEDSYIYEVTSKGAKKINGAYYDDDEGAWVIRTRNLTSYAISDKKLKTVDQMDNGSSSSSGSNSGSTSGSGSNNGKPNPDTGR